MAELVSIVDNRLAKEKLDNPLLAEKLITDISIYLGGRDIYNESELQSKFPYECLEKHGAIELIAFINGQTPRKQILVLRWSDEYRNINEKLVYPTW